MKITLTLEEVNQLVRLSRAEQHVIVEHLSALAKMNEEDVSSQEIDESLPAPAVKSCRWGKGYDAGGCIRKRIFLTVGL